MSMLIGDIIMRLDGNAQFTPPFGRGGQSAQLGINVLDVPSNGALLHGEAEHKSLGDVNWVSLGVFNTMNSIAVEPLTVTGCKEMVRVKLWITGGIGPQVYDTFLFEILPPVWMR